jgi:hypothetical protein
MGDGVTGYRLQRLLINRLQRRPKRNRADQGARRVATEAYFRTPQGAARKCNAELRDLSTAFYRLTAPWVMDPKLPMTDDR